MSAFHGRTCQCEDCRGKSLVGGVLFLIMAIVFGIAKCSGADFRTAVEKECDELHGVYIAGGKNKAEQCLKNESALPVEKAKRPATSG